MTNTKANLAASVRQRLKNLARSQSVPFQEILQRYAIERFLLRLSRSEDAGMFVLKGAQMLVVWGGPRTRPTMDIDLLGYTDNSLDNLDTIFRSLCANQDTDTDGLVFDPSTVKAVRIKEDADYEGVRVTFLGTLDAARVPMQIDIGFNDTVTPAPELITYPSLLSMQVPELRGYNRDTLIAEKVEAMIKLGEINSRMKDFFDIWALSRSFSFNLNTLGSAIEATSHRRGTPVRGLPITLQPHFPGADDKQTQWAAFLRKSRIEHAPAHFSEVSSAIADFLRPAIAALTDAVPSPVTVWTAPGPWH